MILCSGKQGDESSAPVHSPVSRVATRCPKASSRCWARRRPWGGCIRARRRPSWRRRSCRSAWRIFHGFLARIGTRSSEASGLDVGNVNLDLGAADLDDTTTNDPRPLPIAPDVAVALRAWLAHRARAADARLADDAAIFIDEKSTRFDGESACFAEGKAGVRRAVRLPRKSE
jgi:hypothetical protein